MTFLWNKCKSIKLWPKRILFNVSRLALVFRGFYRRSDADERNDRMLFETEPMILKLLNLRQLTCDSICVVSYGIVFSLLTCIFDVFIVPFYLHHFIFELNEIIKKLILPESRCILHGSNRKVVSRKLSWTAKSLCLYSNLTF